MLQLPNTLSPKHLQLSFCSPRFIKDSDFSTQTHFSRQGPIAHILVWASFSLHGLFSMAAGPIPRVWGLNFRFSICMGCCEHVCVCVGVCGCVCVCVCERFDFQVQYIGWVCVCERERERFEFQVQCMGCVCVCWRFEFQVQCMGCESVCVCECVCVGGLNFRFSVWGVSECVCVCVCVGGLNFRFSVWGVCVCVCVRGLNFRFSVWSVRVYMCVRLRAVQVLCVTLGSTGVLPH